MGGGFRLNGRMKFHGDVESRPFCVRKLVDSSPESRVTGLCNRIKENSVTGCSCALRAFGVMQHPTRVLPRRALSRCSKLNVCGGSSDFELSITPLEWTSSSQNRKRTFSSSNVPLHQSCKQIGLGSQCYFGSSHLKASPSGSIVAGNKAYHHFRSLPPSQT